MKSINEAMKSLREADLEETTIEINGLKRKVFSRDELDLFNVMKNRIKGLESYVVSFGVSLPSTAYITFGVPASKDSAFEVEFDTENYGKVKSVKTTFSNQDVTVDFLNLAQELYKLKN